MVARLSRIIPLLIILAVVAGIVYLVATYKYSPNRAKEILIKMFTVITGVLTAFFLLVCVYALIERNMAVFDLAFSFLLTAVIGLVVTRVCRYVFIKHHPSWAKKPMRTTKTSVRKRWTRKK